MKEIELLKFLFERGHKEAELFWIRNNVLFTINTALLGAVFLYAKIESKLLGAEFNAACIFGLLLTIYWGVLNRASRKMNHAYVVDAKELVKNNEFLRQHLIHSVGFDVPSGAVDNQTAPFIRRLWPSGTALNYLFILGYFVAWVLLFSNG